MCSWAVGEYVAVVVGTNPHNGELVKVLRAEVVAETDDAVRLVVGHDGAWFPKLAISWQEHDGLGTGGFYELLPDFVGYGSQQYLIEKHAETNRFSTLDC